MFLLLLLFCTNSCKKNEISADKKDDAVSLFTQEHAATVSNNNLFLADSFLSLRDETSAIPYLEKALNDFTTDNNIVGTVTALNKLSQAYVAMKDYPGALPYSKEAAGIALKHFGSGDTLLATSYYLMGLSYDQAYAADSAIDFHTRALEIRKMHYRSC